MTHHTILKGNCLERIKEIPDNSIDLCLTSPPYHSAKDYSGGEGDIGRQQTYQEYLGQCKVLIKEVFRVLKPWCVFAWNVSPIISEGFRYMVPQDTYPIFI